MNDAAEHDEHVGEWTFWTCILAPAVWWATQFQVRYALVPWACRHDRLWVISLSGILSAVIAAALLAHAVLRWRRYRHHRGGLGAMSSGPFLANVGILSAALFLLVVLVHVAADWATADPCEG